MIKTRERSDIFRQRKLIYLSLSIVLILTALLNVKTYQEISVSEELALENSLKRTEIRSKYLSEYFEEAELSLSSIRSILLNLTKAGKFDRQLMNEMLLSNLSLKQNIRGLWVYLEPNAFDQDSEHLNVTGSTEEGRYAPWFYFNNENSSIIQTACGSDQYIYYEAPKKLMREVLLEPYQTQNGGDTFFITLTQPIIQNRFRGAIGIDWFWEDFNKILSERPLSKKSYSYLISENGKILSHENNELLGTRIDARLMNQLEKVINGEKLVEHYEAKNCYVVITNFKIPYTETNWYIINEIPDSNDFYSVIKQNKISWRIGAFLLILFVICLYAIFHLINFVIKDRKRLKQEFVGAMDSNYEGICVIDRDYRYSQFNNYFQISMRFLLGLELQEGDHALDGLPSRLRLINKENYDKALQGSYFIDEQIHQDRRYRYYYNPIFTEESEIDSFTVRIVDVTDEIKNEEELEGYRKNLQKVIKNKTADLQAMVKAIKDTRLKLVESEKVATLGLLSSGLANELSNPLNFVVGNITPLRKDLEEIMVLVEIISNKRQLPDQEVLALLNERMLRLDVSILLPEIETLIDGIENGANRVKEIVMNFNDLVRPDRQAKFENINRGVELAVDFIKPQISAAISLSVDFENDLPSTYCEVGKLNDAFLTLIDYQTKMIRHGKVHICTLLNAQGVIEIHISNNQRKLSDDEIASIFDPFKCIKGGATESGVRLALCNEVIEAHGGNMQIKNDTDGKGSVFIIQLPVLIKSM